MLWVFVVYFFFYPCSNQCIINIILSQWILWFFLNTRRKYSQDLLAWRKLQLKHWQTSAATLGESICAYLKRANIHVCICIRACVYSYIYTHTHIRTRCKKKRGETGEFGKWWLSLHRIIWIAKPPWKSSIKQKCWPGGWSWWDPLWSKFAADMGSIWSESKATHRMK